MTKPAEPTRVGPDFPSGLILAAPASGSGKTLLTLGLLRALADRGSAVAPAKAGPDYIDPTFHLAAAGRPSVNLDPWAMRPETIRRLAWAAAGTGARAAAAVGIGADAGSAEPDTPTPLLVEGVMGLFDGAAGGAGSTADLAALTGWPVVLIVDAARQAQSAGAIVHGFHSWRADVRIVGVIFNRIGGAGHAALLRDAMGRLPVTVLGAVPRVADLALPARHLGLVPAAELPELERLIRTAASHLAEAVDLQALLSLLGSEKSPGRAPVDPEAAWTRPPPLGQRIALASDHAFRFAYPHLLDTWRAAGAEILPFSPLADAAPPADADAVFLPGGYPELHAGRLAANGTFLNGLRAAAARGIPLYGECGGYMVLGAGLVDADGTRHAMAGLLPVETSFADRRLHLGYREMTLAADHPFGRCGTVLRGHEFHYAAILTETPETPLFRVRDATGRLLGQAGAVRGSVSGSFLHVIDLASGHAPAGGR